MTAANSRFASTLVPAALLVCCVAGLCRAATETSPSVELTPPLDVSVSGTPDVIRSLSAEDFVVTLNGKETPVVSAEALCQPTESEPPRNSTQFFIYFNQNEMIHDSRYRAIQTAKILVPKLVAAGGELAIVADGTRLRMLAPPTSDGAALLRILEQFEQDENRLETGETKWEELNAILPYSISHKSAKNTDRWVDPEFSDGFESMMRAFSMLGPPKVVLYFGDNGWLGSLAKRASAFGGFRIDVIDPENPGSADSYRRLARAAADSGGIYFGSLTSPSSIAERILQKESCLYRLRFERSRVPADAELVTLVKSRKKAVKVMVRASWYAPTPEMISEARFSAALAAPLAHLEKPGFIVQVIPAGLKRGRHAGLVQLRLDAETAGGSAWEFAARGFGKAKLGETFRWRVLVPASANPLMYEAEEMFSEGPYEVVAVARSKETGEIVAHRLEGSMPSVHGTRVAISSIVVMQSGPCRCHRRLDTRRVAESNAGAFALAPGEPVLTDRTVLMVTLVCRGDGETTKYRVESSFSGATDEVTRILADDLESEGCIQLRDKITEDKLKPGLYTYGIRVFADGEEIGTAKHLFATVDPATLSPEPAR